MAYAYAAVITIAVTAAIVLVPIWLRGGRESLVASSRWTVPLFGGLVVIMVLLAVALQQPATEALVAVLGAASVTLAAYRLTSDHGMPRWSRATLALIVVLGSAVTIVVLLGGLPD